MRAAIFAVGVVGASLTLQGCGSGNTTTTTTVPPTTTTTPSPAPPTQPCKNPSIDLVTQSATSTTKLDATVNYLGTTFTVSGNIEGATKIDMDMWRVRIDQMATLSVKGPASKEEKTEVKLIVNADKKLIVEWTKVTDITSGKVLAQNCSAITVAKMPTPMVLSMAWKQMILPELQKHVKCNGSDGTYDTWDVHFVHKKDDPLPLPILPKMDIAVDMDMKMDTNYLMKAENSKISVHSDDVDVQGFQGPISIVETSITDVTQSSNTGPTSDDLDYTSWGTCTPITPPDHKFLNALGGLKKDGKSAIQNMIIGTLQVALASRTEEVVI
mmetsp:Transcript_129330/g.258229  ORF Transcript_129330/g.258229 Transcript_129330/m.258229 type:complete len:327 (+) Transcript_129330:66-1046(+)|eukprot:CAMPEP_0172724422 /NCGR_PEP_ID=MMETSP1074-20121228/85950_1 /TAXON_ID=2916 /ORGANISM="Ceratium fusus, Strain PA161109" /LENGTH=326 /DNA_ID=CAMNT_0013550897 /DNA_START=61 /DNA_END=1041 /DNA_ORIENTATION=+